MAAIDDLKAAVTRLNTSTSNELKAIADKLNGGASDADIEAAAASINKVADNLDAETATLTGSVTSAPVTTDGPVSGGTTTGQ